MTAVAPRMLWTWAIAVAAGLGTLATGWTVVQGVLDSIASSDDLARMECRVNRQIAQVNVNVLEDDLADIKADLRKLERGRSAPGHDDDTSVGRYDDDEDERRDELERRQQLVEDKIKHAVALGGIDCSKLD